MSFCPKCGRPVNEASQAFCPGCGTKVQAFGNDPTNAPAASNGAPGNTAQTGAPYQPNGTPGQQAAPQTKQISFTVPDVNFNEKVSQINGKLPKSLAVTGTSFFDLKGIVLIVAIVFSIIECCLLYGKVVKASVSVFYTTESQAATIFEDLVWLKVILILMYIGVLLITLFAVITKNRSKLFGIPLIAISSLQMLIFIIISAVAAHKVKEDGYGIAKFGLTATGVFYIIFTLLTVAVCFAFMLLPNDLLTKTKQPMPQTGFPTNVGGYPPPVQGQPGIPNGGFTPPYQGQPTQPAGNFAPPAQGQPTQPAGTYPPPMQNQSAPQNPDYPPNNMP